MPITLPALSRRHFLGGLAAAFAARNGFSAEADPNRLFLLSDTHIDAKRDAVNRGVTMFNNLESVAKELLAEKSRAAGVIITGDCAHKNGQAADYATLIEGLKPLREGALPVHMLMGNHDNRDTFWKALEIKDDAHGSIKDRHITVLKTPRANIFLLDSLDKVDVTPGLLGDEQRTWLGKELDAHKDKPSIVMVHHNPDEKPKPTGMTDTKQLLELLGEKKQVKLLIFGHTHNWWNYPQDDGLQCVNLPPVAYTFKPGQPNGWVDMKIEENSAELTLHSLDPKHPKHLEKLDLAWRCDGC